MHEYPRVFTALATPFEKGSLALPAFKMSIRRQKEQGIKGIVVLGSTGESSTVTPEERKILIHAAVEEAGDELCVAVGTGSNSTAIAISQTMEAQSIGAHCALVVMPYYNCPTSEGIYAHFEALCSSVEIPLCLYHNPRRCGSAVDTKTIERLAKFPQIIGIKEASGDLAHIQRLLELFRGNERFLLWSGDDAMTLPIMSLGGYGVISVASNLVPHHMHSLVEALYRDPLEKAREKYFALLPLFRALSLETNPLPVKAALALMGIGEGHCRLPLTISSASTREQIAKELGLLGVNCSCI